MAFWIFALFAIIAVFLFIASLVLPKLFLHNKCALTQSNDRGIKRMIEKKGSSVLYEPAPNVRKYIKKYVLSERDDGKVLVCKLCKKFKFLDYDIVVFDSENKVRCVLNVKELPLGTGYTRVIKLPDEASYVSINLNGVDDTVFQQRVLSRVSFVRVLIFTIASAALIAATVLGIRICCTYIFGGVFSESLFIEGRSTLFTIIIGGSVALADMVITLILVLIKNYKGAGKKVRKSV